MSDSTLRRLVRRLGHSRKKIRARLRARGVPESGLAGDGLRGALRQMARVLKDEMGSNTSLHELYAYSPRGQRAYCSVARNRGKNTTLLSSMTFCGMGPSMVVEGGTDGAVFEGYLRQMLVPALRKGDVVVMDNLCVHKSERVRELIEAAGAHLLYLPPYWPEFNPIEEAFSKIKNLTFARLVRASTKLSSWRSVRRSARSARRMRRHTSSIAATVRRFNYYDRRCKVAFLLSL